MLPNGLAPAWVLPRAKYDLDFANNNYWGGSISHGTAVSTKVMGTLAVVGNSGAAANTLFAPDSDGVMQTFPQYGLRITRGKGLWVEGGSTSVTYALWNRDFTNPVWAWVAGTGTTAKTSVGVDAKANSASRITATSADATLLQSITLTSRALVVSAWIKRVTGVGAISLTVDGGATYTDISGSINSNSYTQVAIPVQTLANPQVGVKFAASGDAIDIDFFHCENNAVATNPMLTTGAINSRGPEALYFNTTGSSFNDGQGLIYDIMYGHPSSCVIAWAGNILGANGLLFGSSLGKFNATAKTDGTIALATGNGASLTTINQYTNGLANLNKASFRVSGFGAGICINAQGVESASSPKFAAPPAAIADESHGGLGNQGSGALPMNGYISRITLFDHDLTDGQMIEYTR